jgi:hypothetical protein
LVDVFCKVASLLSERDFDAGPKGLKCKLSDGRVVDWGIKVGHIRDDDVREMLQLPNVALVSKMEIQAVRLVLEHARKTAEPWPNNSRARETLASWNVEVVKKAFQSATDATYDSETNKIHDALGAGRNTDEGTLPAPAPGHHDVMRFPEFGLQEGLENMAGKVENGIAVWHQHIAAAAPPHSSAGSDMLGAAGRGWAQQGGNGTPGGCATAAGSSTGSIPHPLTSGDVVDFNFNWPVSPTTRRWHT